MCINSNQTVKIKKNKQNKTIDLVFFTKFALLLLLYFFCKVQEQFDHHHAINLEMGKTKLHHLETSKNKNNDISLSICILNVGM